MPVQPPRPDLVLPPLPGVVPPPAAAACRNSSPFKDRPTRLACQIDFRVAGVAKDVVYDVQRLQEGLVLLARDYPDAYDVEAKLKEVPLTDL